MAAGLGAAASPMLIGGISKMGGRGASAGGGALAGKININALGRMLSQGIGGLSSLLGSQQQQAPQGNVYNQMMPSPMLPQQMLPMMQNTFVPQTQMQNFQPYSLLNGNLG